jgi:hypothetical protein
MDTGKCVKLIFIILFGLLGLCGAALVFYGGGASHMVSLSDARADNMTTKLNSFIRCDEKSLDQTPSGTKDGVYDFLFAGCVMQHAQTLIVGSFAGTFTLFAMLSGIVSNCREIKGNQYAFSVLSGTACSLLVVSLAMMSAIVWPSAKDLAPCTALGLSPSQIQVINLMGGVCVDGATPNATAMTWLMNVGAFYAGCGISLFCLVLFMLLNACCSREGAKSEEEELAMREQARRNNQAGGV